MTCLVVRSVSGTWMKIYSSMLGTFFVYTLTLSMPIFKKKILQYTYLNENELMIYFWGHIGLKQPRNNKFKIDWAQAFSTYPHLKQPVHFISNRSFKMHTNSES